MSIQFNTLQERIIQNDIFRQSVSEDEMFDQLSKADHYSCYRSLPSNEPKFALLNDADFSRLNSDSLEKIKNVFHDVIVVPNDTPDLQLNQIKERDAAYFAELFDRIQRGESSLTIDPQATPEFRKLLLEDIRMLMTRPAGRLLILLASEKKMMISTGDPSQSSHADISKNQVNMNYTKTVFHVVEDPLKKRKFLSTPSFLSLGHEMLHILHDDKPILGKKCVHYKTSEFYGKLGEKLAICGLADGRFICENMLRFEFGFPARIGHGGLGKDVTTGSLDISTLIQNINIAIDYDIEDELKALYCPASASIFQNHIFVLLLIGKIEYAIKKLEFMSNLGINVEEGNNNSLSRAFIVVKCDLPADQQLYIRGSGGGLSWRQGKQMFRVKNGLKDKGYWIYYISVYDPNHTIQFGEHNYSVPNRPTGLLGNIDYNFVIDDKTWEERNPRKTGEGKLIIVNPTFLPAKW